MIITIIIIMPMEFVLLCAEIFTSILWMAGNFLAHNEELEVSFCSDWISEFCGCFVEECLRLHKNHLITLYHWQNFFLFFRASLSGLLVSCILRIQFNFIINLCYAHENYFVYGNFVKGCKFLNSLQIYKKKKL